MASAWVERHGSAWEKTAKACSGNKSVGWTAAAIRKQPGDRKHCRRRLQLSRLSEIPLSGRALANRAITNERGEGVTMRAKMHPVNHEAPTSSVKSATSVDDPLRHSCLPRASSARSARSYARTYFVVFDRSRRYAGQFLDCGDLLAWNRCRKLNAPYGAFTPSESSPNGRDTPHSGGNQGQAVRRATNDKAHQNRAQCPKSSAFFCELYLAMVIPRTARNYARRRSNLWGRTNAGRSTDFRRLRRLRQRGLTQRLKAAKEKVVGDPQISTD